MEYLEITGKTTLKAGFDKTKVNAVLAALAALEFDQVGFIDIRLQDRCLSIHADGEISGSYPVKTLLLSLQDQLAPGATFVMWSVRWEFYVVLTAPSQPLQGMTKPSTQGAAVL